MVFTNKTKRLDELNILIDGIKIEEIRNTTFLGGIIGNKLSWKDNVTHVASKVSRELGMIIKARNYMNKNGLITLYLCTLIFHTLIIYGEAYTKIIQNTYAYCRIKVCV